MDSKSTERGDARARSKRPFILADSSREIGKAISAFYLVLKN